MPPQQIIAPGPKEIAMRIVVLRVLRVLLDADFARIYGVVTKQLNEQVKRNARRFPKDLVFQLTREEAETVRGSRSQNATLKQGTNIKYLPYAFTEHGAKDVGPLCLAYGETLLRAADERTSEKNHRTILA